ncbi:NAD-dependent epimerase/dehydratase family protein [Pseudomonas luteola]|uniref:NAD-dependent epimerase/dehydratase family protein n=1 Tax=Pseudomonas luteola TaxID=47886 RepID=UPI000F7AD18E|nr:NAD-dependent epimerase/dehydratase family protein [Pseudomonas luteola]RRW40418.1 NAD-dependent epimerase/dehydratase family protein [Pseudomonas luteola]
MHVIITGAGGFVGQALVQRLVKDPSALPWTRLTLLDLNLPDMTQVPRVRTIRGSIADPALLADALAEPADVVFHLASVPGGVAERDYTLGRQVNLDATLALLERLKNQLKPARLVFASTIAVYGSPLPSIVDDTTPLHPQLSYGAQKLIGEILLDDFARRGWVDGIALRLPGIVARPPQPSGLLSAFMSDVFWKLRDGEPFVCPVGPDAVAWWMSVARCVDNLLHAARLTSEEVGERRAFALPVLRMTMAQLIEGLVSRFGDNRRELVHYAPNEALEASFGRYPPLLTPAAEALGFRHDGNLYDLIERTLTC